MAARGAANGSWSRASRARAGRRWRRIAWSQQASGTYVGQSSNIGPSQLWGVDVHGNVYSARATLRDPSDRGRGGRRSASTRSPMPRLALCAAPPESRPSPLSGLHPRAPGAARPSVEASLDWTPRSTGAPACTLTTNWSWKALHRGRPARNTRRLARHRRGLARKRGACRALQRSSRAGRRGRLVLHTGPSPCSHRSMSRSTGGGPRAPQRTSGARQEARLRARRGRLGARQEAWLRATGEVLPASGAASRATGRLSCSTGRRVARDREDVARYRRLVARE